MAERPFPRAMTGSDVDAVAEMHAEEFPHELLARLGRSALRFYYTSKLEAEAIAFVVVHEGRPIAFALGTYGSSRGMRAALLNHPLQALTLLRRLTHVGFTAAARALRAASTGAAPAPNAATLSYMAVERAYRRLGLGRMLVRLFINEALRRGARSVVLHTQQAWSANEFYQALGFQCINTYRDADGYVQTEYQLPLQGAPLKES